MALKFRPHELETLKKLQHHTADRHTYKKLTTLIMLHNNLSQEFIPDLLGVDRTTINCQYNAYIASKNFETSPNTLSISLLT